MDKGKEYWDQEYLKGSPHLVALGTDQPSISATRLVEYFKEHNIPLEGRLLDVGCGIGRNTNYLAHQGFSVTGADFSDVAIQQAQETASRLGIKVNYQAVDVTLPWPFQNGSFDYIFDSMMSHLFSKVELENYRKEVLRCLAPGGKFIVYTLDKTQDEHTQRLLKQYPGPEEGTYILPEMALVERVMDPEQVAQFYAPLQMEYKELIHRPTKFKDQMIDKYYWWLVFRN